MGSSWRRRAGLNFGGLPHAGLAANAATPPHRAALRHRPTDTSDTPNVLATASGFMPRRIIATPWRRRCSSCAEVPFGLMETPLSKEPPYLDAGK
jgi:hypothetical protein